MEESPGNIVASEKQCSQSIVALKGLRREGGEVVARQVDLLEDLQVGEGAFVDCLDVRLLEADLLKVVQAERTEYVFGKLLQVVAIHDEHLKREKVNSNISYFKTIINPDVTEVFSTQSTSYETADRRSFKCEKTKPPTFKKTIGMFLRPVGISKTGGNEEKPQR